MNFYIFHIVLILPALLIFNSITYALETLNIQSGLWEICTTQSVSGKVAFQTCSAECLLKEDINSDKVLSPFPKITEGEICTEYEQETKENSVTMRKWTCNTSQDKYLKDSTWEGTYNNSSFAVNHSYKQNYGFTAYEGDKKNATDGRWVSSVARISGAYLTDKCSESENYDLHIIYEKQIIDLYRKKKYQEQISALNHFIDIFPKESFGYNWRGVAFLKTDQYVKAIQDFTKEAEVSDHPAWSFANRGRAYAKNGNYADAVKDFEKALEGDPSYDTTYYYYAWLLATCPDPQYRNGKKASEFAEKIIKERQDSPSTTALLAATYAEIGDFADAIRIQMKAIKLLQEKNSSEALSKYMHHLELYKANTPLHKK